MTRYHDNEMTMPHWQMQCLTATGLIITTPSMRIHLEQTTVTHIYTTPANGWWPNGYSLWHDWQSFLEAESLPNSESYLMNAITGVFGFNTMALIVMLYHYLMGTFSLLLLMMIWLFDSIMIMIMVDWLWSDDDLMTWQLDSHTPVIPMVSVQWPHWVW